jgi:hypothetical protein
VCSTTAGITTKTPCTSITDAGYSLVGDKVVACVDQAHCATSTASTCSATVGIATKTPCELVTDAGYFLDGDKVVALCAAAQYFADGSVCEDCAVVDDASARTCNDAGAGGIQTVTCDPGFHESGSAGVDLGCTTCDNQANCATSNASTCSPTTGITTKTPCTLVTDPGYYLDGDKVDTCVAVLNSSARICNAGGAAGIQTVTCDPGFHESGSAGVDLGCTACAPVSDSSARTCNGTGAGDIQTVTCNTGFLNIGSAGNNDLTCIADTDNDGIPDSHEIGSDPNNPVDSDNDGTPNYLDLDR